MKTALLTEMFYPHMAGCERRFLEIGKRLVRRGHEVHVFTLRYDSSLSKEEIVDGMFVHRYAHSNNYLSCDSFRSLGGVLKYSLTTFVQLLGNDFDVFYSNEWPMLHSLFAKPVAFPLVQEWCEVWTNSSKVRIMQEILKRLGDYHVAVSEFTRRRMISFLKLDPKEVAVVPNGVDCSRFCSGLNDKIWGRIVYVGRLVPHKNVELLVNAFRKIKEKTLDVELHIVGSSPLLSSIKDRASDVEDYFIHGFLPESDMIDLLKSAWLFVLPSEREGSGIVAIEAMATGTPVITLDFPDNAAKELVDGMNGLVVSPKADAIALAALDMFYDEGRWWMMSEYARSFAEQYDWEVIAAMFEGVLRKVVEQNQN